MTNAVPCGEGRRPAIVLTIGRLAIGGAEMRLLYLARELQKRGSPYSLVIFVVSGLTGELDGRFREVGCEIVYGRPGLAGLVGLWRLCRQRRPLALHINAGIAAGFYGFAGLLAGAHRRIAHLRDMANPATSAAPRKLAYELTMNLFCNEIVAVSDGAFNSRLVWRRQRRIYNAIPFPDSNDYPAIDLPPTFPPRIVVLGRISPEKNLGRALRIHAAVLPRIPDAMLDVVGPAEEPARAELELQGAKLGLGPALRLSGTAADPSAVLAGASALLLTSEGEGLPGVVIEALACGVPVVASDLPGVREIATRQPGVAIVSLDEPDASWVDALVAALAADRAAIREAMRVGPFVSGPHVDAVIRLWLGLPDAL